MTMTLLNPHGSDETYLAEEDVLLVEYLLNPHGSDETQKSLLLTLYSVSMVLSRGCISSLHREHIPTKKL